MGWIINILEDVGLDLRIVRIHMYNFNSLFTAADHMHVRTRGQLVLYSHYRLPRCMDECKSRRCCCLYNITIFATSLLIMHVAMYKFVVVYIVYRTDLTVYSQTYSQQIY
jgi:hypothetical protein